MLLTDTQTSALLNRTLTSAELANYELYMGVATERLQELLCITLCGDGGPRTYGTRDGYRTVYVDPFKELLSVTVDGNVADAADYTIKQNNKFNGKWFNIIEFNTKRRGENIVVDADWGFHCLPGDLQLLLAAIYDQTFKQNRLDRTVNSKKIEDYTVTYNHSSITMSDTLWESLVKDYVGVVEKYSQCDEGSIRHGCVRAIYPY